MRGRVIDVSAGAGRMNKKPVWPSLARCRSIPSIRNREGPSQQAYDRHLIRREEMHRRLEIIWFISGGLTHVVVDKSAHGWRLLRGIASGTKKLLIPIDKTFARV